MVSRRARFRKVASLADTPTPARRVVAALVAGALAFSIIQLLLGVWWGAGWNVVLFSSIALAVAAAVAALTMRRGLAVVYGILAALWLLGEAVILALGSIVAGLG
jgi:hypothetical protein